MPSRLTRRRALQLGAAAPLGYFLTGPAASVVRAQGSADRLRVGATHEQACPCHPVDEAARPGIPGQAPRGYRHTGTIQRDADLLTELAERRDHRSPGEFDPAGAVHDPWPGGSRRRLGLERCHETVERPGGNERVAVQEQHELAVCRADAHVVRRGEACVRGASDHSRAGTFRRVGAPVSGRVVHDHHVVRRSGRVRTK